MQSGILREVSKMTEVIMLYLPLTGAAQTDDADFLTCTTGGVARRSSFIFTRSIGRAVDREPCVL